MKHIPLSDRSSPPVGAPTAVRTIPPRLRPPGILRKSPTTAWFVAGLVLLTGTGRAADAPYPGTITITTPYRFDTLVTRVEQAVAGHRMGLVAQASASHGAAARGIRIPGNAVLMVFRNDFAVRVLQASVAAGIEAPLRIYVAENVDGSSTLTYRRPSAVFAPYASPVLDSLAKELDVIFQGIVRDATGH